MVPVGSILGAVFDSAGQPVPGAKIEIASPAGPRWKGRSDAGGQFSVSGLALDAQFQLTIGADDFLQYRKTASLSKLLAMPIVLSPASEVCVSVSDRSTDEPIPKYVFTVFPERSSTDHVTRVAGFPIVVKDSDGRGCVRPERAPPWLARVEADGYAVFERRMAEYRGEINVELGPEAKLQLLVVGAHEIPVADAAVFVDPPDLNRPNQVYSDREVGLSDSDGRIELGGLEPGDYSLLVRRKGFLQWNEVVTLDEGTNTVRIDLQEGATVSASVVSSDGASMVGARVKIHTRGQLVATRLECTTDSSGQCEIPAVPAGAVDVLASAEGYGQARRRLVVDAAADEASVVLTLRTGVRLVGQLLGTRMYPHTRFDVLVTTPGTTVERAPVGEDSRFAINDAPEGVIDVVVLERDTWSRFLLERHTIRAESSPEVELTLELPPPLLVSGRVTVAHEPCTACEIRAKQIAADAGAPMRSTRTSNGDYELRLPFAGSYLFSINDRDTGLTDAEVIEVRGDELHDFDIGNASLSGTVRTHDGDPARRAEVRLVSNDTGTMLTNMLAGDDGSFAFSSVSPGSLAVNACSGGTCATDTVQVLPGDSATVDLVLPQEEKLLLRFIDSDTGVVLRAATIMLMGSEGSILHIGRRLANPEGVFELPTIGSPPWVAVIGVSGHALATRYDLWPEPVPQSLTVSATPRSFSVVIDTDAIEPCFIEIRDPAKRYVGMSTELPVGPVPFTAPRALFGRIEPGQYTVTVTTCAGARYDTAVYLAPGFVPELRFPPQAE